MFNKKLLSSAVLIAGCASSAFSAAAALEEIVVTAQKRSQNLSDVPIAIDAVTESDFQNKGVSNFLDIPKVVPSASFGQSFSDVGVTISIRGIPTQTALDPTVAYYLDETPFGVPGAGNGPTARLYDIQRVEVLRGPQGTLYGQGAMGGTIRLITNNPDASEGFGGNVRLKAVNTKDGEPSYGGDVALNIPLIEDVLAARVVYSKYDQGGFVEFPGVNRATGGEDDLNESEFDDWRVKVQYTPSDELLVRLTASHSEVDSPYGRQVSLGNNSHELLGFGRDNDRGETEYDLYSLFVSYEFDGFTLENGLSYIDYLQLQDSSTNFNNGFIRQEADAWTNEFRLVSNGDGPWGWIAGTYLRKGENKQRLDIEANFAAPLDPIPFLPIVPGFTADANGNVFLGDDRTLLESETWSVFGEVSYKFFDDTLEVLVGARYFEDERDFSQSSDDGFGVFNPFAVPPIPPGVRDTLVSGEDINDTFESLNPRFNVTYRPNDDLMIYFNAAKGYRSGTFNAAQITTFAGADTVVAPDELWSYEIGTKFTAFDGSLNVEATYFMMDWQDAQISVQPNPLILAAATVNGGDLDVRGFEFSVKYGLTENLTLSAQGAYIDTEWDVVQQFVTNISPSVDEGEAASGIPKKSGSISLDYITDLGDDLELLVHGGYNYRSSQLDSASTGVAADKYVVSNLRFQVSAPENWSAALFIDNVTNNTDATGVSFGTFSGTQRPREIGASFTKHF